MVLLQLLWIAYHDREGHDFSRAASATSEARL